MSGIVTIPRATLKYSTPVALQFFSQEERYALTSRSETLVVRPLPAEGRPADFNGAVASGLKIDRRITPQAAKVGEGITVALSLAGEGNTALWPAPEVRWPAGSRAYSGCTSLRARNTRLLQSRVHLPGAHHRGDHRRSLGRLRAEEPVDPAGNDSGYVGATPYHLARDRSHGYRIADSLTDIGADFNPGVTIPNSGWNAPLDDLATYLAFLTGSSDKTSVLGRKTLEEMWRPVRPTGATLPELSQVGLGFFSTEVDGRRIAGHTGDQAGYRSFVYFDPERRTGLVIVFNTTNDAAPGRARLEELAQAAIALLH